MAEYIDKEQLLSDLYSKQDDENLDMMFEIANFPAADVAPVVRCSQCQHGQFDDLGVMHCHKYHCHKKENDFCSYGEKREDRHE